MEYFVTTLRDHPEPAIFITLAAVFFIDRIKIGSDEGERLVEVWEASVRATHHFLSESDIELLKPSVLPAMLDVESLLGVRDESGVLVGFLGVAEGKIEALFVHPSWHRLGAARRLVRHAVKNLGATRVDVNEQNEQAVAFYLRLGFRIEGRSDVDSMGLPFPLIHMRMDDASKL
jgi:putative acetyltransferase